jgi:maleylacetate reductase
MTDATFISTFPATRVVFGVGALGTIGAELERLALGRPLVITTRGRTDTIRELQAQLGSRLLGVVNSAVVHVPADRVRLALSDVTRFAPDSLLAVGGGSAIGLAKAIALERPLPIVAVPTTYSGSEMTSVWGVTDGDTKRTGRHSAAQAKLVIYDPALTVSLPPDVSATSGMNAMAHAVEALYAPRVSAVAEAVAEDAIRLLGRSLPAVAAHPGDVEARTMALRGAHLAGLALELATMGLHHRLCHVLGGTFGLPHAPTHAALLPHVVAFNASSAPGAMARAARALGADPVSALHGLNRSLGVVANLGVLGLRPEDIEKAATRAVAQPYANPRPATLEDVRGILEAAL